ncbi:MAG: tRNA (N(6)-L-threonylcarbamoyladenosine(37)-C(2))-methylthiotransferase MtaB [Armatimonadota bacterium]
MPTVAYYTLGCKVNQYETERIRAELERAGFRTVPFGSIADVYIVNTCSVTSTADAKSRAAIRKAHRLNPDACIAVTGCYVQLEAETVASIDGVSIVAGTTEKEELARRVLALLVNKKNVAQVESISQVAAEYRNEIRSQSICLRIRTRAIVKIQDGCDHFCSYCVVPYARPIKRSRPANEVLSEIEELAEFGYKEIILTGIRLGAYQDDKYKLPELINLIVQVPGVTRVRLSSIEPWEVDTSLLEALEHPKICKHLHIPLQSGNDEVLARMNRPYSSGDYLTLVKKLQKKFPGIGITTDVMVGFPGETDEAFQDTCNLVREAGFARIHVFRYSPRKRTCAAEMPNQVPESVKKARSKMLLRLGQERTRRFVEAWIDKTLEVLVESRSCKGEPEQQSPNSFQAISKGLAVLSGFADNYIEARFLGKPSLVGNLVTVRVIGVDEFGRAVGRIEVVSTQSKS